MTAASNSEARASLADRIRSEASISDRPGQLDRLEAIATEVERLQSGARTLGHIIEEQGRMVLDVTGMHHVIDETGDGDWAVVWERLYELVPKAQAPLSQPIPAVDSGAIGRLNEALAAHRNKGSDVRWDRDEIDWIHWWQCSCGYEIRGDQASAQWFEDHVSRDALAALLREHTDRALAEHRRNWSDYFEHWSGAVGPEPLTIELAIEALRAKSVPFGRAARQEAPEHVTPACICPTDDYCPRCHPRWRANWSAARQERDPR